MPKSKLDLGHRVFVTELRLSHAAKPENFAFQPFAPYRYQKLIPRNPIWEVTGLGRHGFNSVRAVRPVNAND